MKGHELNKLGIPRGDAMRLALQLIGAAVQGGMGEAELRAKVEKVTADPKAHVNDANFGKLAQALIDSAVAQLRYIPRAQPAAWRQWGTDLEEGALEQMRNSCQLPVAVRGALMPDAHQGYGLPIGGVLATRDAVIPYAVGVDIACRMKLTVLDLPVSALTEREELLTAAIHRETRFGMGAAFRDRRNHAVMDDDWSVTAITRENKDKAWGQLGTSGSGNHFVEFGELTFAKADLGMQPGTYLALLSHSGSRGTGAAVASHYSKLAMSLHPELPRELTQLAWLDLDSEPGQEYWNAMNLILSSTLGS